MHTELFISKHGASVIDVPLLPNNSRKTASVHLGLFCVTSDREVGKREAQWFLLIDFYLHLSIYPDDVGFSYGENLV